MGVSTDTDDLRRAFATHADTMARRAPVWASVSRKIAHSPDGRTIIDALMAAPAEQRRPVLALAALHDLALQHVDSPLGRLLRRLGTSDATAEGVWTATVDLVDEHGADLERLVTTRHTQTNEVGRCAVLLPALAGIAETVGALSLIEFGSSAGLLLNLDRYRVRYRLGDSESVVEPAEATPEPVELECTVRSATSLPAHMPLVASRLGVDPVPVDIDDPVATRWLQACVWPDQIDRLNTLRRALDVARSHPVPSLRADGVERIPAEISALEAHPTVISSWALTYVTSERRRLMLERLDQAGQRRDLTLVLLENPSLVPELPIPGRPGDRDVTVLAVIQWRSGKRREHRLGTAHPHGYWWDPNG